MLAFCTVCVLCGTILVLWRQVTPLAARLLTVLEARAAIHTPQPIVAIDEPMPSYAKELIASESEPWARADLEKLLRDYYSMTHDWTIAVARAQQAIADAPVYTGVLLS